MPALLIDRLLKVAIPPLATTVAVPLRVPLLGLVPITTLTEAVLPAPVVTRLLFASKARTVTAGLIEEPACVFVGCCPKARWSEVPWVMLNVLEVAPVSAPDDAVSV